MNISRNIVNQLLTIHLLLYSCCHAVKVKSYRVAFIFQGNSFVIEARNTSSPVCILFAKFEHISCSCEVDPGVSRRLKPYGIATASVAEDVHSNQRIPLQTSRSLVEAQSEDVSSNSSNIMYSIVKFCVLAKLDLIFQRLPRTLRPL